MRNLRWQILIAAGGLILVIGLLAGQSPTTTVTQDQPIIGGTLTEGLVGEIIRINPILDSYNQVDRDINALVFSGLIRFDARGNPLPDLAESWAISADASLYTLTLREDATWHDGTIVNADDIIYTYSKLQDADYPGPQDLHELWSQVKIIRLDQRRVQFQLPESFAPFLDYLTIGLLPDHLLRGVSAGELIDHPFNLEPVGTGPFRFAGFLIEDSRVVGASLTAFDDYFGQRPFLERVDFRLYSSTREALAAYQDGEILALGTVDVDILGEVLDDVTLNTHTARLPRIGLVFLNLQHPEKTFLADKVVRHALLMAINRDWLIQNILRGQGIIPIGPFMPGTWAYAEGLEPYLFDPIEAARLLESLGWALPTGAAPGTAEYVRTQDEQRLAIELAYADNPVQARIADGIRVYWEAIGVQVSLVPSGERDLMADYLAPREYEAVLSELNLGRYPDPDPYPFWHDSQTETGQNYTGFTDRNSSIWLEQARTNPDPGRRAELYRSFQFRFQDQIPALMLYYPTYTYGIDAQMQGVSIGPLLDPSDRYRSVTAWHILARHGVPITATGTSEP
jgi:peptide/nickel transport system substrate-binding protein